MTLPAPQLPSANEKGRDAGSEISPRPEKQEAAQPSRPGISLCSFDAGLDKKRKSEKRGKAAELAKREAEQKGPGIRASASNSSLRRSNASCASLQRPASRRSISVAQYEEESRRPDKRRGSAQGESALMAPVAPKEEAKDE